MIGANEYVIDDKHGNACTVSADAQATELRQLDTLEREDETTSLAMVLAQQDWPSNADIAQGKAAPLLQAMVDGMKARDYTPALAEPTCQESHALGSNTSYSYYL